MKFQQVTTVTCSNCNHQFETPFTSVIDGQDPFQKRHLLQGRANVTQCPQCGVMSMMDVPIYYYDLEKELAFIFNPSGLSPTDPDQQKRVGDLTNSVVNQLPTEQRKYYLFNPKQFLTLENMVKAILEADGITEEMMERQKAKVKIITDLLEAKEKEALKQKIKDHDEELDREFFDVLMASIQSAQTGGDQVGLNTLLTLRELLVKWSSKGKKIVKEIDKEMGQQFVKEQEELLEDLLNASDEKTTAELILSRYLLLDYNFFQNLTNKIDAAAQAKDKETEEKLKNLRKKILDMKSQFEEESEAAFEEATELLKSILSSKNPPAAIKNNLDKIDQTFFTILSANIQEAYRNKHAEMAQGLEMVGQIAMSMLQEREEKKSQEKQASPSTPKIHLP